MFRVDLFISLSLHVEDSFVWFVWLTFHSLWIKQNLDWEKKYVLLKLRLNQWNNLEHSYLFMAMMWRKWGAINLNIGCDGERHLLAAMQIPSMRKCVLPSRGEKVLNDSFLNSHFCSFFFFTKLNIHKINKKNLRSIYSLVLKPQVYSTCHGFCSLYFCFIGSVIITNFKH